jgi:hypothetical protein
MVRIRTVRTVRYNMRRVSAEGCPARDIPRNLPIYCCSQAVTPREARGTGLVSRRTKFCRVVEKSSCCASREQRGFTGTPSVRLAVSREILDAQRRCVGTSYQQELFRCQGPALRVGWARIQSAYPLILEGYSEYDDYISLFEHAPG